MTKKPNAAKDFIEKIRRSYPSLFNHNHDVILSILGSSNHSWTEDGNIVDSDLTPLKESFTDEGWEHLQYGTWPSTSWELPRPNSAISLIPSHASEEWLSEIEGLCHAVEKLDMDDMRIFITVRQRFEGTGPQYQEDYVNRNLKNFIEVKFALILVHQRCRDIRKARQEAIMAEYNALRPATVEVGATVHHHLRPSTETAEVLAIHRVDSINSLDQPVILAILTHALCGSPIVRVDALVALKKP